MSEAVEGYLIRKKEESKVDSIVDKWHQMGELYQKKLWHQLTVCLLNLIDPANEDGKKFMDSVDPMDFYQSFIAEFQHRVNPVALVRLALTLSRRLPEPTPAVEFLTKIQTAVKTSPEGTVLVQAGLAETWLRHRNKDGKANELVKVREIVEDTEQKLNELPGVTPVHGDFYKVSADYLREKGDFAGYYKEALRYLGCGDLSHLTESEKYQNALCLALAALLGDDVYNFGELLAHPILDSLRTGEHKWIVDLLYAFNAGDLAEFQKLEPQWSTQLDLAKNKDHLGRKIRLLCLMEMAYVRPANKRQLSFNEIAKNAQVPINEVEYLVMKALSLGLVKGSIDEVDEKVSLTWVQPRVLDMKQVTTMANRIQQWCHDVTSMHQVAEDEAEEMLSH